MVELDTSPQPLRTEISPEDIGGIVDKHGTEHGALIAILEEIQTEFGYLPEAALRVVSERTGSSLVDIYGIANFYHAFSLTPRGKHMVSVCLGTACHVRGAQAVAGECCKQLGIRPGETTADGEFSLQTVNCLGACALGPVAVVDGRYFSKLARLKIEPLLESARNGFEQAGGEEDERLFPVAVSCPSCNHSLMDEGFFIEGRSSIRVTVAFDHQHGWLRLSSIYGRYSVFSEHEIPQGAVLNVFCPHCHAELISSWTCPACGAPMVQMIVRGGGVVRICSRRGCCGSRSHMLDLR
jgi:NADH-quinone oxidoreductase subunit E